MAGALLVAQAAFARDPVMATPDLSATSRLLHAVAAMYSLDPDLLVAIAQAESDDRYDAISPAGAAGLMQLMPDTAIRFGVTDRFDPVESALGAARFLRYLQYRDRGGRSARLALPEVIAAYNAGEGAVERYDGIPPYPETQKYVRRVLWSYLMKTDPQPPRFSFPTLRIDPSIASSSRNDAISQLVEIKRLRTRALDSPGMRLRFPDQK